MLRLLLEKHLLSLLQLVVTTVVTVGSVVPAWRRRVGGCSGQLVLEVRVDCHATLRRAVEGRLRPANSAVPVVVAVASASR